MELVELSNSLNSLDTYILTMMHPSFDSEFPELTNRRIELHKKTRAFYCEATPVVHREPYDIEALHQELDSIVQDYKDVVELRFPRQAHKS